MKWCRVGEGVFLRTERGQNVWRFPLSQRGPLIKSLEAARGVRCSVEDLHAVPKAFLEVRLAVSHPYSMLRLHCIASFDIGIGCRPGTWLWDLAIIIVQVNSICFQQGLL